MAKFETYRVGNAVRIRSVGRQRVEPVVVKPAAVHIYYDESFSKAELIAAAEERGLDSSGSKAELVERLNA